VKSTCYVDKICIFFVWGYAGITFFVWSKFGIAFLGERENSIWTGWNSESSNRPGVQQTPGEDWETQTAAVSQNQVCQIYLYHSIHQKLYIYQRIQDSFKMFRIINKFLKHSFPDLFGSFYSSSIVYLKDTISYLFVSENTKRRLN
jgi:hypothetical protein